MENENPQYAYPLEWQNFGDANPKQHGGLFVKWENGYWHIIETRHKADLPKDLGNGHMFEHMYLEPMDIWQEGKPEKGFTERTLKELDTFSRLPFQPINPDQHTNEYPDMDYQEDYVNWYLENEFVNLLPYLVHLHRQYIHSDPLDFDPDYWGYLTRYGIEKDNF